MVLQAEAPSVYGAGPPGSSVTVMVSGSPQEKHTVTVAKDGSWVAALKPRPASPAAGPGVTISVEAGAVHVELTDVLFGDVWVCSGQVSQPSVSL